MKVRSDGAALNLSGIAEQTLDMGLQGLSVEAQLSEFAQRVAASGFPMKRVSMGMATLHPQYGALTYVWRPGAGRVENTPQRRSILKSDAFQRSPINFLLETGEDRFRQRIDDGTQFEFPVLEEIRREGMTDYAASLVRFGSATPGNGVLEGVFFACATDDPQGFQSDQLDQVFELLPHLALSIKARMTFDVARTISQTYLGEDAGHRVLTGEIALGSTRSIDAVIWFCDLRGFTTLASNLDRGTLITLLNTYLDVMAHPVEKHNGQILKFMGDGFLATFQLADAEQWVISRNVLIAAQELRSEFASFNRARNAAGEPTIEFGLALHVGEVFYGNIGAGNRLDFTVIGPAVNLASRVQDLCRPLDKDILISSDFYDAMGRDEIDLEPAGRHDLRGVGAPQDLFTIPAG